MIPNSDDFKLGNLKDKERNFQNFQKVNSFLQIDKDQCMYSSTQDNIQWSEQLAWVNWCPAANAETGTSVYHQHSKHNTMIAELKHFIFEVAEHFGVDLEDYPYSSGFGPCINEAKVNEN